jgi:hypothetical protein
LKAVTSKSSLTRPLDLGAVGRAHVRLVVRAVVGVGLDAQDRPAGDLLQRGRLDLVSGVAAQSTPRIKRVLPAD